MNCECGGGAKKIMNKIIYNDPNLQLIRSHVCANNTSTQDKHPIDAENTEHTCSMHLHVCLGQLDSIDTL